MNAEGGFRDCSISVDYLNGAYPFGLRVPRQVNIPNCQRAGGCGWVIALNTRLSEKISRRSAVPIKPKRIFQGIGSAPRHHR
jgi:hypothetical protein